MRSSIEDKAIFALRRAWFVGVCSRADLKRAFPESPAGLSKTLRYIANFHHQHLMWKPRIGLVPMPQAARPPECATSKLLDLLAKGCPPQVTGVFDDDGRPRLMPAVIPVAQDDRVNDLILAALMSKDPDQCTLRILYVGLRRGEAARWRMVRPRALEFTGTTWRLHAQDMEAPDRQFPIKVFVLYRIMDAQYPVAFKRPGGFADRTLIETHARLRVSLSEDLTPAQEKTLRWGLGIKADNTLQWPHHSLYEFKREWAKAEPSTDIVWPVLTRFDEVK